jgi:hypothetical protein
LCGISGELHPILAHNLAVWDVRVVLQAVGILRAKIFVKEIELIEISWSELSRVNIKVSEKSGRLENCNDIRGAHISLTVTWFYSLIDPAILFRNG